MKNEGINSLGYNIFMTEIEKLAKDVREIQDRNQKVQRDKAWETSWVRRLLVFLFTYLALGLYMWAIDVERPWLSAIIPAVGFWLSTLTLPFFKNLWEKYFYKG
jgi:sterol desaturase/sphingolipid hydroxylase (fatty acid hydroxylase superfamily)